jgi:starch-binding outer membrane protein, SusD/RagB family
MHQNKLFPTVLLSGVLMILSACGDDFVDLTPPTTIRADQYFQNPGDIATALNGVYGGLRGYYGNFFIMAEIPSDNTEANSRTNAGVGDFDRFSWEPTNGVISNRWSVSYTIISRCNTLLERMEPVTMDPALKERYRGEAKFIRALMYFNLVQFFGDVPLVLTEIRTEDEAYRFNRESRANVYAQIENDLQAAASVLPATYPASDAGRVTSGAAKALLGKVYLTKGQFGEAAAILREVIEAGTYQLLPVYADVFRANNGNHAEIVFSVQYTRSGNQEGSNFAIAFAPTGAGPEIVTGGNPESQNQGTLDLFNAFEAGDLRRSVSITQFPTGEQPYYTRKFLDQPPGVNEGQNDWPVIRYSDVLLMYAEALNELGRTTEAEAPLNEVRSRAGLAPVSDLSPDGFRLAVEQERRVELCFEGHRWFDLLRTGRMVEVMSAYAERYRDGGGFQVNNYQLTPNKVLYPVPFREISLNANLGQNPGY